MLKQCTRVIPVLASPLAVGGGRSSRGPERPRARPGSSPPPRIPLLPGSGDVGRGGGAAAAGRRYGEPERAVPPAVAPPAAEPPVVVASQRAAGAERERAEPPLLWPRVLRLGAPRLQSHHWPEPPPAMDAAEEQEQAEPHPVPRCRRPWILLDVAWPVVLLHAWATKGRGRDLRAVACGVRL